MGVNKLYYNWNQRWQKTYCTFELEFLGVSITENLASKIGKETEHNSDLCKMSPVKCIFSPTSCGAGKNSEQKSR